MTGALTGIDTRAAAAPPHAHDVTLKSCFADPLLDVMNFLNEVVLQFPDAISFAPGRPEESLFRVDEHVRSIGDWVNATSSRQSRTVDAVWRELGQYGRTNGMIAAAIAAQLAVDERIHVQPDAVMVTVGAQEAMAVLLTGLFDPPHDVLLVSDPTYIGITGLARILGIRVVPVPSSETGVDATVLERVIKDVSRTSRPRAFYDIPDFNNPLGSSLNLADRHRLLDVCRRHDVLLFEDNAYGMFAYDGARQPTLKSLDECGTVVYIGSYSKTLFPGLRLGYLVADQTVRPSGEPLAKALSRVKSLITVNTPPPLQALLGAVLDRHGGSLEPLVAPKRARYREQRDTMLASLRDTFGDAGAVRWNRPAGGFFLTATLPFAFGADELRQCAAAFGVIVCPMQFFCLGSTRERQIRLSFSYVTPAVIAEGIERLGRFVRAYAARAAASGVAATVSPWAADTGAEGVF